MSIVVLCPTRGRPDRAADAFRSFQETKVRRDTRLVFVVDADDPTIETYLGFARGWQGKYAIDPDAPYMVVLFDDETGDLVKATNAKVHRFWDRFDIIGHIGDDHLFRTSGWDGMVERALEAPGVAYGNDGHHGENIPTAAFLSSSIVKALGWLALPTCHHLYIDNAWYTIGQELGARHYLPTMLIEHMHPLTGKAPMDEGYAKNNAPEMYDHDGQAYRTWVVEQMPDDIARVRAALAA